MIGVGQFPEEITCPQLCILLPVLIPTKFLGICIGTVICIMTLVGFHSLTLQRMHLLDSSSRSVLATLTIPKLFLVSSFFLSPFQICRRFHLILVITLSRIQDISPPLRMDIQSPGMQIFLGFDDIPEIDELSFFGLFLEPVIFLSRFLGFDILI
jgi:hypothetical protein